MNKTMQKTIFFSVLASLLTVRLLNDADQGELLTGESGGFFDWLPFVGN